MENPTSTKRRRPNSLRAAGHKRWRGRLARDGAAVGVFGWRTQKKRDGQLAARESHLIGCGTGATRLGQRMLWQSSMPTRRLAGSHYHDSACSNSVTCGRTIASAGVGGPPYTKRRWSLNQVPSHEPVGVTAGLKGGAAHGRDGGGDGGGFWPRLPVRLPRRWQPLLLWACAAPLRGG